MRKNKKVKRDRLEITGVVVEACPAGMFRVKITSDKNTCIIIATLSGKMRQNFIKIVLGDYVVVEISQYDTSRGRIIKRTSKNEINTKQ